MMFRRIKNRGWHGQAYSLARDRVTQTRAKEYLCPCHPTLASEFNMRIIFSIITFTLACVILTGCKQEVSHQLFARESEVHDMDRFAAAQSAAGARQDGMLYAHHFSGT